MTRSTIVLGLIGGTFAALACEPASVTEARDQLGRGGERDLVFAIAVRQDTISVADVLRDFLNIDFVTILDSLAGMPVLPIEAGIAVADAVGAITGVLDPSINPLLTFSVEQWQEVADTSLDLGQFEDAVRDLQVNTALVTLTAANSADAPITLSDFTIGVVQIDAATNDIRRDGGGNPLYENDAGGQPILLRLPSSGSNMWSVPRNGTAIDTLPAGQLVDRLVDLLLDGVRTALVEAGTVEVGDGTIGTIAGGDSVRITVEPVLGFDFTFGSSAVRFSSSTVQGGLDLDTASEFTGAEAIAQLVDSAVVTLSIENGTAFVVEAVMAVVEGDFAGDVFMRPDRVDLGTSVANPGTVDAQGRSQNSGASTRTFRLTGTQSRVFFGSDFTAGLAIELRGPPGGRSALRTTDRIVFEAKARVKLRTGGGQ